MAPDLAAIASLPYLAAAAPLRRPLHAHASCPFPPRRPPPIYLTCAAFPSAPPCAATWPSAADGQHLFRGPPQPRCSNVEAVGDVTAAPGDYTENLPSSSGYANDRVGAPSREECLEGSVGKENHMANQKMIKISDKLIGVFMVDKPTPTDWRKLLAFSREWDNIRPHFFKRCRERADAEPNPEMKHSLLRLARKLKEIDEDVQRHNELVEVVRSTPSEKIGSVIAKRRKDFTVEFFNHLYYVAESYKDDPDKQKGRICLLLEKKMNRANKVSFSNHKTKKQQFVNLQYKKLQLRLSTKALKTIEKHGLDAVTKKAGIDLNKK